MIKRTILAAIVVVAALLAVPERADAQCKLCEIFGGTMYCAEKPQGAHGCSALYNPWRNPPWDCFMFGPCGF